MVARLATVRLFNPRALSLGLQCHEAGSADLSLRSAAFCCRLGTNRPDASGRYNGPNSVHHPEFTILSVRASIAFQPQY